MYGEFTYGLYYMNRCDSEPSAKMCGLHLTLVTKTRDGVKWLLTLSVAIVQKQSLEY